MPPSLAMPAQAPAAMPPRFSAEELRDPVVIMALFEQLVTEQEVEALWKVWRLAHLPFRREPFWRLLLQLPHTDPKLIYEQAARVAGIETAFLSRHSPFAAIRTLKRQLSRSAWRALAQIPIVPVAEQGFGHQAGCMIFATEDATAPRLVRLLEDAWPNPYELRYAAREDLVTLLETEKNDRLTRAGR